jgi:Kef-type K+ transport system membrane component KefB
MDKKSQAGRSEAVLGLIIGVLIKKVRLGIILGLIIGGTIVFLSWLKSQKRSDD